MFPPSHARRWRRLLCAVLLGGCLAPAWADQTLVAVAANFTAAAQDLATAFKAKTGHEAVLSFGSTGKLYTQIVNGAPFQVFLAADDVRPQQAVAAGLGVDGTRFTYAIGRLVLYSPDAGLIDATASVLGNPEALPRLAIANPGTAPYGAAAIEVLKALGYYDRLAPQLVQGDSITQAWQFVATGNAPAGFVAASQLVEVEGGSRWVVPQRLYSPIRQDAVLLRPGADDAASRAFLEFLASADARAIIEKYGYGFE